MKKTIYLIITLFLVTFGLTACKWKPSVTAVTITKPWSELKLPIEKDAVVWGSTETQFKAVHKDDRKKVADAYKKALEAAGLKMIKFEPAKDMEYYTFEINGIKLEAQFYDFDNTGVIIDVKK